MMKMHRYHPLTIAFDVAKFLKGFVILVFVVILNSHSDALFARMGRILLLVAFILTIASSILKWFTYRYATDESAFYLQSGIFEKTERTVYFNRIQNVQRHTSFLHKLFGVTSITFETGAAGSHSTIQFDVLTVSEADDLEAAVKGVGLQTNSETLFDGQTNSEIPLQSERIVHFTPTRKDTIKASFTSFSFLLILVIGASIFSKLNRLFDIEEYVEGWVGRMFTSPWLLTGIAVLLVILAITIGIVWTFIRYGTYEIASDTQRIYIAKGILDESAFAIAKNRVQGIEITQSMLKRLLGLAEVKLISAGNLGEGEDEVSTLYPFLPINRAYSMVNELLPPFRVSEQSIRLPKKSLVLRLVKPYWVWLLATACFVYFRPEILGFRYGWVWISAILFFVLAGGRVLNYWNTTYSMTNDLIQLSTGTFEKTTFITRREKIIEVSVKRTKLQQLTGLATFGLINRAQPVRHDMLKDVTHEEAKRFYQWYATRKVNVE